ncbi:MAG: hypothetical protein GC179_05115 [Anaerolineaceae bacterium]|nr:hypothetical protein [Anaerolineaceae bacterium]
MFPKNVMYYGADRPLPEQRHLQAGPLSMIFENGDLRYIRLGQHEIIRRIYAAIRDPNWGTVPNALKDVQVDGKPNTFKIHYSVDNQQGDIDFVWTASITGDEQGTITFSMEGEAQSTFRRNRIGFCILHPIRECAGRVCRIEHADGTIEETTFPKQVVPQIYVNGQPSPHGSFHSMNAMRYPVSRELWAELRFEGDLFELEDQRNWIDGSYKTYCTPIQQPFPVEIQKGTRISQCVTLSLRGTKPQTALVDSNKPIEIRVLKGTQLLPPIGLSVASHEQPLTEREVEHLRLLNLSHLRVELNLWEEGFAARLRQAVEQSHALDVPLEIALIVSDWVDAELGNLLNLLNALKPRVMAWLVFHRNYMVTPDKTIQVGRAILSQYNATIPLGGGCKAYFADLNRKWPQPELNDFVTFTANPQVHAVDNSSIIETAASFTALIQTATQHMGGKPVALSPLTLKARFNPVAIESETKSAGDQLPTQVDPRQMSLFAAGWTLACLKYLSESGNVSHVSLYETTGWLGVMEREKGSPLPDQFSLLAGCVFPIYHVVADLCVMRGGDVIATESSAPLKVESLFLQKGNEKRLLLANLNYEPHVVQVNGLGGRIVIRELDEFSFEMASCLPQAYRASTPAIQVSDSQLELTLQPYAYLCINFA